MLYDINIVEIDSCECDLRQPINIFIKEKTDQHDSTMSETNLCVYASVCEFMFVCLFITDIFE